MLLDVMIGIPPRIMHGTTTTSDLVTFLVIVGVIVVVAIVAIIAFVIAEKRGERKQSQMKEAEPHYAVPTQPQGGEQPQVHAPEEEKVLIPQ